MDVKNVRSWVGQFKESRRTYENKPKEPRPRTSRSEDMIAHDFRIFHVAMQDGVHTSNKYAGIGSYLFHSQAAVFHNNLFHARNHVTR